MGFVVAEIHNQLLELAIEWRRKAASATAAANDHERRTGNIGRTSQFAQVCEARSGAFQECAKELERKAHKIATISGDV